MKSSVLRVVDLRQSSQEISAWGVLESLWIGLGRYPNIPSNSHVLDGRKVGRVSERFSAGSGDDNHKNKLCQMKSRLPLDEVIGFCFCGVCLLNKLR